MLRRIPSCNRCRWCQRLHIFKAQRKHELDASRGISVLGRQKNAPRFTIPGLLMVTVNTQTTSPPAPKACAACCSPLTPSLCGRSTRDPAPVCPPAGSALLQHNDCPLFPEGNSRPPPYRRTLPGTPLPEMSAWPAPHTSGAIPQGLSNLALRSSPRPPIPACGFLR